MLAFEESFTVGLEVDAALRGDGDFDAAWDLGSSIWSTATIRAGLRALQEIIVQLSPEQRPGFLGLDISKPYRTARALRERGHDAPVLRAIADRGALDADSVAQLETLCRSLEADGEPTTAALARNLRRHVDAYLAAPDLSRLHRRDTHMARTLLESLPERGITVVWAHNEHLARNSEGWGGPTMGHVLHEALRELGRPFVTSEEFTHPGPRRFIGWQVDSSLFANPQAVRDTFEVPRPSSDFAALAFLPRSTADVTVP